MKGGGGDPKEFNTLVTNYIQNHTYLANIQSWSTYEKFATRKYLLIECITKLKGKNNSELPGYISEDFSGNLDAISNRSFSIYTDKDEAEKLKKYIEERDKLLPILKKEQQKIYDKAYKVYNELKAEDKKKQDVVDSKTLIDGEKNNSSVRTKIGRNKKTAIGVGVLGALATGYAIKKI